METLGELQRLFASLLPALIQEAHTLGFTVRLGEAYRPPETARLYALQGIGIANSLHCDRLAIDLILDRDGVWQKNTETYLPLGEFWEKLHPLARWGGRFRDGNHFSLAHGGAR